MAQSPQLTFPQRLFAKALIKRARSMSSTAFLAEVELGYLRNEYIIKVLEAPASTRDSVRTWMEELEGDHPRLGVLRAALLQFEALPDNKKEQFIVSFKGYATALGQGSREVWRDNTWDDGHIPPRQEP